MLQARPNDDQVKLLRVLQQRGAASGNDLKNDAGIKDNSALVEALRPLIEQQVVAASKHLIDEGNALNEFYSVMPSAVRYVRSKLLNF